MSYYSPQLAHYSKHAASHGHSQYNQLRNRFISYHHDRLYLGWVFLRSKLFQRLPIDLHNLCYQFVDQTQLIINLPNLAMTKSLSLFFSALITSSMPMLTLSSVSYNGITYKANSSCSAQPIIYPKDPESVQYNLSCSPDRFNFPIIAMWYNQNFNHQDDEIVAMFQRIGKFLKTQSTKDIYRCDAGRLLQNISINIGGNRSLIMLSEDGDHESGIKYDEQSGVALYRFEDMAWKNAVNLYELLKGVLKIQGNKWTHRKPNKEPIYEVSSLISHDKQRFTLWIDFGS